MNDDSTTIDATLPGGAKVQVNSKRMAELITIGLIVMTSIGAYVLWQQGKVLERLDASVRDMANSQRELACIISLPQDKREQQYTMQDSFCKRMARMQ